MGSHIIHIDPNLPVVLGLCIQTSVLATSSFVVHVSVLKKAVKTAKYFVFPKGLRLTEKRNGDGGTGQIGGTLSHEGSDFDLIIWNGQSAFVDEESL